MLGLRCCAGLRQVGATLQLCCMGFSCCGAPAIGHIGFRSCGTWSQQLQLRDSRAQPQLVEVHKLHCSEACGILQDQGLNSCLLLWQVYSLPLSHQRSLLPCFYLNKLFFCVLSSLSCVSNNKLCTCLYSLCLLGECIFFQGGLEPVELCF